MNELGRAAKYVTVAVAEQVVLQGASTIEINHDILLLSSALRIAQKDALIQAFTNLRDDFGLISTWAEGEITITVTTTETFPPVDLSNADKDILKERWIRRVLLFKLYDVYRQVSHRYTDFPLIQLADSLGISEEEVRRNVDYLGGEYLLENEGLDGGTCTSDITQDGIKLCENTDSLFEQFGVLHIDINHQSSGERHTRDDYYVSQARIEELGNLRTTNWDFTKLVALCNELNVAYKHDCYFSIAMLVRAIMDHIPPVFGFASFSQVTANYKGGRSFKQLMERMDTAIRSIADTHLHSHIRSKEPLPTYQQVNCTTEMDILLAEIVSIAG